LQVYVYGTKFNVSAYDDDSNVETVLEKGCVNVNVPHSTAAYKMLPGQCFTYNKYTHSVSMTDVDVYERTAWKDKKMVFRDTSLETVLKHLSRHFNVDIVLRNHNKKEYQYHATFREETLSQILNYLSKSVKMRWHNVESIQQDDDTLTKEKVVIDLY
jgi:ferric-dicitrate binding protein FerR (iron transport regulator)